MGEPIIIWPPCGGNDDEYGDQVCVAEAGAGFSDCSDYYYYLLQPGEIACCPGE
jgi:hypothetical protein